jgi:hypothetical protein
MMIPHLNPTKREDQQFAVAQARQFAPGLVEQYKAQIGEQGIAMLIANLTSSEEWQAKEPLEKLLALTTLLGAMAEMTADN